MFDLLFYQFIILLFVFFIGLFLGSFCNVLIYRIPQKKSIFLPRSYCPDCKHPIVWYDNIPIVSYIWLKGKCRHCNRKISIQYPLVELIIAFSALLFWLKFKNLVLFTGYFIFVFVLVVISGIDSKHHIIPDILSIPLISVGLIFSISNYYLGYTKIERVINSFSGILAGIVIFYTVSLIGGKIYKKEALGGGDIKLVGAIGGFLGCYGLLISIFIGSLIGTVLSLVLIYVLNRKKWRDYLPYGPFLSAGAIIYLLLFL